MGKEIRFEVTETEAAYRDIARIMLSDASDRDILRYARIRAILALPFEKGPERDALVARVNAWNGA